MKTLVEYISEALIQKASQKRVTVKPKDKNELLQIISDTIKKEGNECNLNFIDTSEITNMSSLFSKYGNAYSTWTFNGDISEWDVSNVTNMEYMFANSDFNGDISDWNVSNVVTMKSMFFNSKFNGDIFNWDVSNVKNMRHMFADSDFNSDISNWDVSNVVGIEQMFANSKFAGDISNWDVSNVINITNVFGGSPAAKMYTMMPDKKTPKIKNGHFVKKK